TRSLPPSLLPSFLQRCAHSEKKYGSPVSCEQCKMVCAFNKPDDVKRKVGGQTLCLLCTINFKKAQFKRKQHERKKDPQKPPSTTTPSTNTAAVGNRSLKHRDRHRDDESSASKKAKLDLPPPPSDATSSPQFFSTLTRDSQPIDLISSNHLMETDRLYSEIASLKKQVAQKEQGLLDKDKQICQLKAETMEKEKEFRTKFQSQLKSHSDSVESLQAEIRNLRRQLSQSSHKSSSSVSAKGTGSAAKTGSSSSSAHASLAAALTSGVS
ncbi:Protein FAM76A, partial [Geodia barretti]